MCQCPKRSFSTSHGCSHGVASGAVSGASGSSVALLSVALLACTAPAVGRESDADRLEEIIVTAQRREERLLDVPIAISVIGEHEITKSGVQSITELQYKVPGLSMFEYAPGQTTEQIRGISPILGLPTVGRYIDEISVNTEATAQGLDIRLIDIERVEVLRGPQGTLFGEGSMGGTIRYLTAAPDLKRLQFKFDGSLGEIRSGGENYTANAVLNLPVAADVFGVRLVAGQQKFGGWVDNTLSREKDVNAGDITTLRLKGLWKISDRLSATLLYQHSESEFDNQNLSGPMRTVSLALPTPSAQEYDLFNLVLRYDLGFASLVSSSGYIDRGFSSQFDISPLYLPVLSLLGYPPGAFSAVGLLGVTDVSTKAQELRLVSTAQGALRWSVGASYRDSEVLSGVSTFTTPDALPFVLSSVEGHENDSKSWATFGELSYGFTTKLTGTLGLRYFHDNRAKDVVSITLGSPARNVDESTFTTVNPRAVLMYEASDSATLYASAAKGFRSGGFNAQSEIPNVPATYDAEKLWTYELGSKMDAFARRLSLEGAIYWNRWDDIQVQNFPPGTAVVIATTNGGKASGYGAEGLLTLRPTKSLTLSMNVGYTNMQYDSTSLDKHKGDDMDCVPRLTGSASAEYRFRVASADATVRLDYQYRDEFSITIRNYPFGSPVKKSDSLRYLNARVSAQLGPWEVGLYGENLTDDYGVVFPATAALVVDTHTQPRSYGLFVRAAY